MTTLTLSTNDVAQKFIIEAAHARGVIVHLTQTYKTILEKHDYPAVVKQYLGEVLLAIVMLMETIKLDGRMIIQFQSDHAIKMLVAQINNEGQLRALAHWDADATEASMHAVFSNGQLVITIFQNGQDIPSQSIVPLQGQSIAAALQFYFSQSEQLPTYFSFAVKDEMASGMLLQKLPENTDDQTTWEKVATKFQSIDARELLYDNNVSFLQYYFPEEDIRLFDAKKLEFRCGCSVDKMANAIYVMGEAEANLILKEKSEIVVTCDYCNHHYAFDRTATEAIFHQSHN